MQITASLLTKKYSDKTNIEDLDDPIMVDFMNGCSCETFNELSFSISQHKVKNVFIQKKNKKEEIQTISFVYQQVFNFPGNNDEIKVFVSKNSFDSVLNILHSDCDLHHSHVTGKIIGYTHNFCNQKVRENKKRLQPLRTTFSYLTFFVMKDLRLCVWRTKNLNIGGKGINNPNYLNIGD